MYLSSQIGLAGAAFWKARGLVAASPNLGLGAYRRAFDYGSPYRERERLECALGVVAALLAGRQVADTHGLCMEAMAFADDAVRAFPQDLAILALLSGQRNKLGIRIDGRNSIGP